MKNYILIGILTVVTVLSYWILQNIQKEMHKPTAQKKAEKQLVAFGVVAKYYGQDNQLNYLLKSPEVTNYTLDEGTDFKEPDMTVFNENIDASWIGTSNSSHLTSDNQMVYLNGDVKITKDPELPSKIVLTTDEAVYDHQNHVISGDNDVLIKDHSVQQLASGFHFYTKTNQFDFDNRIKASYQ